QGILRLFQFLRRQLKSSHLRAAGRMFLAQWMAAPPRRHQQASEGTVSFELNAEHVPRLALIPIRVGPEIRDRRHRRVIAREWHFQAEPFVSFEGGQLIKGGKLTERES